MALTSTTNFDIIGQTQTITFYESSTQVDQISYASNQITFQNISLYSISKSDFSLYMQYLTIYYNLLLKNFPALIPSLMNAWPSIGTSFSIAQTNPPFRIVYTQNSLGTTALNISYLPLASTATFAARASPVTVSIQEWFTAFDLLNQFNFQVATN